MIFMIILKKKKINDKWIKVEKLSFYILEKIIDFKPL